VSRIATQVLLLTAVPLAFLLMVLGASLTLQEHVGHAASISQAAEQALADAERAIFLVSRADRSLGSYQSTGSRSALASYRTAIAQLSADMADVQRVTHNDAVAHPQAVALGQVFARGISFLEAYRRAIEQHDAAREKVLQNSPQVRRLNAEITGGLTAFESVQRRSALDALTQLRAQTQFVAQLLVALAVLGTAASIFISLRFGLRITHRIGKLAQNAIDVSRGDAVAPLSGRDEIAHLDRVYREMLLRIQSEQERVAALQRALLPQRLPSFPGLRIDVSYLPAAGEHQIGGDWYDVFQISARRIGISIGDVAGHGLQAAAAMGQVRQSIRTLAFFHDSPADVLKGVNEVFSRYEGGVLVTAFYATLDMLDGTLTYSFAGHPPPLLIRPSQPVGSLSGSGFVLGVERRMEYRSYQIRMDAGSALVLYTDGVIERGATPGGNVELLEGAAESEYREASHNIAQAIHERVLLRGPARDDSAVVFLGITALGQDALRSERAVWTLNARSEPSARRVKRALLWHLGQISAEGADLTAAEIIASEILGNVARHTPGPAEVTLEWGKGRTIITVQDQGPRFDVPQTGSAADVFSEGGRGIFIIRAMSPHFSVEHNETGNCVSAILPIDLEQRAPAHAQSVLS
jgi:serine phosphatase RsbU (regulator of sigma subunit)/anti-sigma regulatory factor (Ser/Thr protein kinase)